MYVWLVIQTMHRNLAIFDKFFQQIIELIATKISKSCATLVQTFTEQKKVG